MFLFLLLGLILLLALWVAAGCALLLFSPRRVGQQYRRDVAGRIYCPGEDIPVRLTLLPQAEIQPLADRDVALAIDSSSSMGTGPGSPLRESVRAAENFVRRLNERIAIGIVAFDDSARLLSPPDLGNQQALNALRAIRGGGGTRIDLALDCCLDALRAGRAGVNKVVLLLSDGGSDLDKACRAAERLRAEFPNVSIICIGFGSSVDQKLMTAIADSPEHYLHIKEARDIASAFRALASIVSGHTAVSGVVDEGARAPSPFHLRAIGDLHPIDVRGARPTRIEWVVPVIAATAVEVSYDLTPVCPGWHDIAANDSRVMWETPTGKGILVKAPGGPKVLVLPWWMRWAWWLFNPLFWMLFGRFWPCETAVEAVEGTQPDKPLPVPSLPALPPPPASRPYRLGIRPALVIGLGEVGEWTVCRIKARLLDRGIDSSQVEVVALRVTHAINAPTIQAAGVSLDDCERMELNQDLRPYLESLRTEGVPPMRAWVPWREWLAETLPQTTARTVDSDRRKARVALLRKPSPVETRLRPALSRVLNSDNGVVVVVGSPDDAEFSGMAAEVAHICAASGVGVTAIFAPRLAERAPAASVMALAEEIERMVLMSGSRIVSDRHEPPISTKQLFDRIVVIEQTEADVAGASSPAAELIWNLLAFDEVFGRIPVVSQQHYEVIGCGALIDGYGLPDYALWEWAREHFLAERINGQRLGLVTDADRTLISMPLKEEVAKAVEAFWTAHGMTRLPNPLLLGFHRLLQGNDLRVMALLATMPQEFSSERLYHQQVAYAQKDRYRFLRYLQEWCFNLLESQRLQDRWGLALLMKALISIDEDFQRALFSLSQETQEDAAVAAYAVYAEYAQTIINLRGDVGRWLARLAGPQPELKVEPMPAVTDPLCFDIEAVRRRAQRRVGSIDESSQRVIETEYSRWATQYGDTIIEQIRFAVQLDSDGKQIYLVMKLGDTADIRSDSSPATAIRDFFNGYRQTVAEWPLDQMIRPAQITDPASRFLVGKHAAQAYPQVTGDVLANDPGTVAAIGFTSRRLRDALEAHELRGERQYAWPEEANATRIAQRIRNQLRREPRPLNPLAVHLMSDTEKLFSFLSDLGQGRVVGDGGGFVLRRNGESYEIGPGGGVSGFEAFHSVIHQVVSLECSLGGKPIPRLRANWVIAPEEAIRAVERHPLALGAASSSDWPIWQDIIRGLVLEHSSEAASSLSR